MRLYRFFCEDISPEVVTLDSEESHHLRVLRLDREGQEVELFDGAGNHRTAKVVSTRKEKNITLTAVTHIEKDSPAIPQITLALSPPKGERQDTIVQMCQELALSKLVPMLCERSVRGEMKSKSKLARWRRVTISAAKQSGVNYLTEITAALYFSRVVQMGKEFSLPLIFTPHKAQPIVRVLQSHLVTFPARSCRKPVRDEATAQPHTESGNACPPLSSILFLIGPEGDFTENELKDAENSGFTAVTLPLAVLRIETAAIAALTLLRSLAK